MHRSVGEIPNESTPVLSKSYYYDSSIYEDKERENFMVGILDLLSAECRRPSRTREVPEMDEVEKKKKRKLNCGQTAARLKPSVPTERKQNLASVEPSADYNGFMEAFLRFAEEDVNAKLEVLLKEHEKNLLLKKKTKLDDCEPEKLKEIINLCKSRKGFLDQMELLDKEQKLDWTEFMEKSFTSGKQGPLSGILAFPQPITDEKLILQNFMKKHCELYKKFVKNRTGLPDLKEEVGREEDVDEEEDLEDVSLGREETFSSTECFSQPATSNFGDKLEKHLWPEKYEQAPKVFSHQCYPLTKEDSFMADSVLQVRGEKQFRREWNSAPLDTLQRIKEEASNEKFNDEESVAHIAERKTGAQKLKKAVAVRDSKKEDDKKRKLDQSHLKQKSLRGKQSVGSVLTKGSLKEARIDASDLAAYRATERQASALPGPGKYDVPRWPYQQNLVQNVVPFNSKTKRAMTMGPGSKDVPGCGSYNVRDQWDQRFGPMPVQSSFGGVQAITPAFQLRCGDKLTEKCVGCGNMPKTAEYWYSSAFGVMCNDCYKKEDTKHNIYNIIELKTFMPARHCSAVHEHCGKNTHLLRPKKELLTLFRKEAYFAQFVADDKSAMTQPLPAPEQEDMSDFVDIIDDSKKELKKPTAKDIAIWHRRKRCLIEGLRTGKNQITYKSKKVKAIPRTASSSDQNVPDFSYVKVPPNVLKLRTPPWPDVLKGIRALEEEIPGRKTPPEWEERESVSLEGSKEKVEEQEEVDEVVQEKDEDAEDAIQEEVKEEKVVVVVEEEELQEVGDDDEEMTVYNSATEIQRVVQMMGGVPPLPEARPKIDLVKTLPPLLRRELPVQVIKLNRKYLPWFLRRQFEGRDASIVEKDPGKLKPDEEGYEKAPVIHKQLEARSIKDNMSFGAHWFHHSQQAFINKALGEILKEEAANVKSPQQIIGQYLAEPIEHKYVSFKVVQLNDVKRLLERKKKERQHKHLEELYEKIVAKAAAVPTLDTSSEQKIKIMPRKLHFYAYDQ